MKFKNWRILPLVCLVPLIFIAFVTAMTPLVQADDAIPNWSLEDASGKKINFYEDSEGRPAVLLFWATWCPYCRALLPNLEAIRREFSARGVAFYALNIWEDADPIAYMNEKNYDFHLLLDADDVAKRYGIKGTPGLIAVDKDRQIVYQRESGKSPEQVAAELTRALEELLQ